MGRRAQIKNAVPVHINIPLACKEAVEQLAEEADVSVASIYRSAIQEYVDAQGGEEKETEEPRKQRKLSMVNKRALRFLRFLARHIGSRPKDSIWITRAQLLGGVEVHNWDKAFVAAQLGVEQLTARGYEAMVEIKKDGNTVTGVYVRILGDAVSNVEIGGAADALQAPEN